MLCILALLIAVGVVPGRAGRSASWIVQGRPGADGSGYAELAALAGGAHLVGYTRWDADRGLVYLEGRPEYTWDGRFDDAVGQDTGLVWSRGFVWSEEFTWSEGFTWSEANAGLVSWVDD